MASVSAILTLLNATRARRREQWLTAEQLRERRVARLRRLATAAARTPYWAGVFGRAGFRPDDLDDGPGLERLPILDKSTVKAQVAGMLTAPVARLFAMQSSGSTGTPVAVYRSEREQAEVSALHARVFGAFGRRPLDRQLSIGSGLPAAAKGPVHLLRNAGLLPPMHRLSSFDPFADQIATLRRIRPDTLNGYAVALEQLAEAVIDAGVRDIRPRLVYTGSTATSERCRRLIQEAFGTRPFDVYATMETGPVAWECPESPGDYHLNDDVQLLEIVDDRGRRLPDGETGEVAITPLTCLSTPLFRYRLDDLGARRPYPCRCGRGLALMGQVEGRSKHLIRTSDGRVLNSARLGSCFSDHREIRRWQAHETGPDALRILLMTTGEWTERTREAVVATMRQVLGDGLGCELVLVEEIPLAPNGKFQTIVPLAEDRTG
jgi:phenylacetate-CoA ligase